MPTGERDKPVENYFTGRSQVHVAECTKSKNCNDGEERAARAIDVGEEFGCSQFFVGMVAKNVGAAESVRLEHEEARVRWGQRRRMAREDRERRKVLWGRDA